MCYELGWGLVEMGQGWGGIWVAGGVRIGIVVGLRSDGLRF